MLLLLSLVKFQANEQEAELELEVGPENDDGQAEKWRGNIVVVVGGGWEGGVASAVLTKREHRTPGQPLLSLKIQRERTTE